VLVYQVQSPLLGSRAFPFTRLNEAAILSIDQMVRICKSMPCSYVKKHNDLQSYPLVPFEPLQEDHGFPRYEDSKNDQWESSCCIASSD